MATTGLSMSTRVEAALAQCDRLIAGYEVATGGHMTLALLRIGRDVLTRHTPYEKHHLERCTHCYELWTCPDVQPWLDLLDLP